MISQRMGRLLSAVGALLLIGGPFLTRYHIARASGFVESATGFDTFTRLRLVILAGALCAVIGGVVDSTREVAERYPDMALRRSPAGEEIR